MSKTIFEFINSTSKASLEECREFLNQNPNELYNVDEHGNTTLIKAASAGRDDLVELFLEKNTKGGEYVDKQNKFGWTALHFAAHDGYELVIKNLIVAHANIEISDHCGYTPLCGAVIKGHMEATNILLENHANCKHKTNHAGSATLLSLQLKTDEKITPILTLLLKYGGDPFDKSVGDDFSSGDSVWSYICFHDMDGLVGDVNAN